MSPRKKTFLEPQLVLTSLAILAVLFGLAWAVAAQLGLFREERTWRLTTGLEEAAYDRLGTAVAELLSDELPYERFETLRSRGSAENIERIASGEADFAFAQSDAQVPPNARLLAELYPELVHVFVRRGLADEVRTLVDLARCGSVSLGPEGSGTRDVARQLLEHFEIELGDRERPTLPADLDAAFASGELDAAVVLAPPGATLAERLLDSGLATLVGVGGEGPGSAAEGFVLLRPAFHEAWLPQRLYGTQPPEALPTVGVTALFVVRAGVDPDLVRQVTDALHEGRTHLAASLDSPLGLGREPSGRYMALHPGAESYYLREEPSFLVEYAEVISLTITLLVGVWSLGSLFLRWTANLKKERIDRYYDDVNRSGELPPRDRLARLDEIQRKAFEELMAERLAANDSFLIFHDHLLHEISRTEGQLARGEGAG